MNKKILAQEAEIGKIRDNSVRMMAQIYFRAEWIAKYTLDEKNLRKILKKPPEMIKGVLGEAFHYQMLTTLSFFLENEEFSLLCRRLTPNEGALDDVIAFRKALLIPLRQSVGSCFATAFLIHLQKTNLMLLSKDLYYAMSRKHIKRIVNNKEIRIPLCPKTGVVKVGDIHIASSLMKSYEYTVAALADSKANFSTWNFHEALGLNQDADGGLGKVIYTIIEQMLETSNDRIEEIREQVRENERGLDADDALFRSASNYDQMDRIKRAAKAKQMQSSYLVNDFEDEQKYGESLSTLYKFFVDQYLELFPFYFQELYDPEMFSKGDIIEDRPAGFRLVYKHGRADARVWTYITTDKEYIGCLSDFIKITEPILLGLKRGDGIDKEMEEIVTQILYAIDSKSFLQEQKGRIFEMHKKYLKEETNTSPYAYTAGGSLETLTNSYLESINPIKKEEISAKDPKDLCFSLLEYLKDSKSIDFEEIEKSPFSGILMTNHTHAFNLLPAIEPFKKSWQDGGNSYTYMRDFMFDGGVPIIFADTNWEGKFLAFYKEGDEEIKLVLYDGFSVFAFTHWDEYFKKDAVWTLYTYS